MTGYTRAQARSDLDAIYARIPRLICKGLCSDTCTQVDASEFERQLVRDRGVELPPPVRSRTHFDLLIAGGDLGRCPALGPLNTCTVYTDRPLLCRSYGTWRTSACEHGCLAERMIEMDEFVAMATEAELVSRRWIAAGRP